MYIMMNNNLDLLGSLNSNPAFELDDILTNYFGEDNENVQWIANIIFDYFDTDSFIPNRTEVREVCQVLGPTPPCIWQMCKRALQFREFPQNIAVA